MHPNAPLHATYNATAKRPFSQLFRAETMILLAMTLLSFACDGETESESADPEQTAQANAETRSVEQTAASSGAENQAGTGESGPEAFSHEIYVENIDEAASCEARQIAFEVWMDDLPRSCSTTSDCTTVPTLGCPTPVSRHTPGEDLIVSKRDAVWRVCEKKSDIGSCRKGIDCIGGLCRSIR